MPNLISVRRLARFYENDTNTYLLLIVEYELTPAGLHYTGCHFYPIEHIRWECLTLGALGWGQIQIANANHILFDTTQTRQGGCSSCVTTYRHLTMSNWAKLANAARGLTRCESIGPNIPQMSKKHAPNST